jgi:hypothetical protein
MHIQRSPFLLRCWLALALCSSSAAAQDSQVTLKFKPASFVQDANGSLILANKVIYETNDDSLVPKARAALLAVLQRMQARKGVSEEWTVDFVQNSDDLKFAYPAGQLHDRWRKGFRACMGRWFGQQEVDARAEFISLTASDAASESVRLAQMSSILADYIGANPECVHGSEDLKSAGDAIQGRTDVYLDNRVKEFALPTRVAHLAKLYDDAFGVTKAKVQDAIQTNTLAYVKKWLDTLANFGLPTQAGFAKTQQLLANTSKVSAPRFISVALIDLLGEAEVQRIFNKLQGDQVEDPILQSAITVINALAGNCASSANAFEISGQSCNGDYFAKIGWLIINRNDKVTKFFLKP